MKTARVFLLLTFCHSAYSQIAESALLLVILDDSLRCESRCKSVRISFKLINPSNEDILIYGLERGGPYQINMELSELCGSREVSTGVAFTLHNPDGRRLGFETWLHTADSKRRVTRAVIDSMLHAAKIDFLKSSMIVKARQEMTFVKEMPLEDFELENGIKYLQIAYYCGKVTADMPEVKELAIRTHAKLFQGCAMSNRIPLFVE